MKRGKPDGRMFVRELVAPARTEGDGTITLAAPMVGLFRHAPAAGSLVEPGAIVGELEVLGVPHRLLAPAEARGLVLPRSGPVLARRPVAFGDVLVRLDPEVGHAASSVSTAQATASGQSAALQFRSPLSGRFYARPGPGTPPFVSVGDVVTRGQTVALLEVMKTFNRLTYGGDHLPERARVVAVHPRDEDDLDEDDAIFDLEPA
jgi:acetyl-CoA carboxylase biotin carboxyl carrier protein